MSLAIFAIGKPRQRQKGQRLQGQRQRWQVNAMV